MLNEDRAGPFLLDPKRSETSYELSIKGNIYRNYIDNQKFELEYVAYIDSYIKFEVTIDILDKICKQGFFEIWDPIAPYNYFEGLEYGYLVIFRVYKIKDTVPEILLTKGRSGRNFYYKLGQPYVTSLDSPVLDDLIFENIKLQLIGAFSKAKVSFEIVSVL